MTPAEFAHKMRTMEDKNPERPNRDAESSHREADALLLELIQERLPEYVDGIEAYLNLTRWFA